MKGLWHCNQSGEAMNVLAGSCRASDAAVVLNSNIEVSTFAVGQANSSKDDIVIRQSLTVTFEFRDIAQKQFPLRVAQGNHRLLYRHATDYRHVGDACQRFGTSAKPLAFAGQCG